VLTLGSFSEEEIIHMDRKEVQRSLARTGLTLEHMDSSQ